MSEFEIKLAVEKIPELFDTFENSFSDGKACIPKCIEFLKDGPDRVQCTPIGLDDGLMNFIYRLSQGDKSVVVKWARLVPRIAEIHELGFHEDKYTEGLQRNVTECKSLKILEKYVPNSTPQIYWIDSTRFFFIMEDLKDSVPLKTNLDRGLVSEEAFRNISTFMSDLHKATHVTNLSEAEFEKYRTEFDTEISHVCYQWNYEESFTTSCNNSKVRRHTKELDAVLPEIIDNEDIRRVNKLLLNAYRNDKVCLIHGDSHTGFVMIDQKNRVKVIDLEFANICYPARDVGYFLGEVIVWYYVNQGRGKLDVSEKIKHCSRVMITDYVKEMEGYIPDLADFMHYLAANAGHFNAIRTVNLAPYSPFDDMPACEARCVSAAIRLMKGMHKVNTVDDFVNTAFSGCPRE